MATTPPVDSTGATINLGATVKLVCTVIAVNQFDNRYNDVLIQITHPITGNPGVSLTGGDQTVPSYRMQLTVPGPVLTIGS